MAKYDKRVVDGFHEWYLNGKLDRKSGAARINYRTGEQGWYKDGLPHCTYGPAIIISNRGFEWYINGVFIAHQYTHSVIKIHEQTLWDKHFANLS